MMDRGWISTPAATPVGMGSGRAPDSRSFRFDEQTFSARAVQYGSS